MTDIDGRTKRNNLKITNSCKGIIGKCKISLMSLKIARNKPINRSS